MNEIEPLQRVHGHACAHLVLASKFSRNTLETVAYVVYGGVDLVQYLSPQTAKDVVEAVRFALVEVCGGVNEAPGEILERYNYIVSLTETLLLEDK